VKTQRICPVCNQPLPKSIAGRQRHEQSSKHVNAQLRKVLAKRGEKPVSWTGEIKADMKRRKNARKRR
jgi:hypothetical protein